MATDTYTQPTNSVGETPQIVNVQNQFSDDDPSDATTALIGGLPAAIKESKAGYKTTEFWAAAVASILVVLEVIPADADTEGIIVSALAGLYALSRGIAKKGVPVVVDAKPEDKTNV